MKFSDILSSASSNMLRSKVRTFLTVIAVFIGALTLSLTNGIGAGVSSYIDTQLGNIGAEDVLIIQPKQDLGGQSEGLQEYNPDVTTTSGGRGFSIAVLSEKDIDKISAQEGILSVEPMLSAAPEYITTGETKYKSNLSPFIEGTRLDLVAGETFVVDADENQTIIPVSYVEQLGFDSNESAVGAELTYGIKTAFGEVKEVSSTIVGVQQESLVSSSGVTANQALTTELYTTQIEGLPAIAQNQYPAAVARFDVNDSEEELQSIKDSLDEQGYQAMTVEDTIGIIKQVINAITAVLNFFAAIALLAASFGIINTLLMSVQERTKEIGLMKAIGMSSKKIFLLFSTEAVLLGFWGSILGVAVANIIGRIVNSVAADSFLKDLPGFDLMSFPASSMAVIVLIVMAISFLAGTLPARRAAKQNPIDALRYE